VATVPVNHAIIAVPFATDRLVELTQGLLNAGFTTEEIHKIMGDNSVKFLQRALPKE
jgi:hypothetical protein